MFQDAIFISKNYFERNHFDACLKKLKELELNIKDPEHTEAFLLLVDCYSELDQEEEAKELIYTLLREYPDKDEIIDKVIELSASIEELQAYGLDLVRQQIKKYPDNTYYPYMHAHLGFYCLSHSKVEILENLEKVLHVDDYLDTAFDIYGEFGMNEEQNECLRRMIISNPEAKETRKCHMQSKLDSKSHEEFIEIAIDYLKQYPEDEWTKDKIEDVTEILYGDYFFQILNQLYFRLEKRFTRARSDIYVYFSKAIFIITLFLAIIFYLAALPFLLVRVIVIDDYIHIHRLKNDPVYRKINQLKDRLFEASNILYFYFKHSSNSYPIVLFHDEGISLAKDRDENMKKLRNKESYTFFDDRKDYVFKKIKKVKIGTCEIKIFEEDDIIEDENIIFSTLDSPEQIHAFLLEQNWTYSGDEKESTMSILLYGSTYLIVSALALLGLYRYQWNEYLMAYVFLASITNFFVYCYYRLKNKNIFQVYSPLQVL
jgi:hypothetical protein